MRKLCGNIMEKPVSSEFFFFSCSSIITINISQLLLLVTKFKSVFTKIAYNWSCKFSGAPSWEVSLSSGNCTVQKMKFSITDFFSKFDQICSFLWTSSHLRDKSLMELIFFIWYCRWFFLNHHLKCHRRINITCYGKTEVSFAKSLVFVNNVSYRVNSVSYRNRSIDLQQKFFTEKVIKWNFSEVSLLVTSDKYFTNEKRRLCALETTSKFCF